MARLEEVLPEWHKGEDIRRRAWGSYSMRTVKSLCRHDLDADDWEVVPDPVVPVMGREVAERHASRTVGDMTAVPLARDYLRLLAVAEAAAEVWAFVDGAKYEEAGKLYDALRAAGFLREGGEG